MLEELSMPAVMGILNVTPDSFSDGGKYQNTDETQRHAEKMIRAGADIIDIGGESTRPGAKNVSAEEELARVIPVIEKIRAISAIPLSIDTSTPEVILAAAEAGVDLINDVRALRREGALNAAVASGLPVCLMHMQGDPETMQMKPDYVDVVTEIREFLVERINVCVEAGIHDDQIVIDPGFGFGKTPQHNLQIINRLEEFKSLGKPLLVGLSRKSTIGIILEDITDDRLIGSVSGALFAVNKGAAIVRVHDVAETVAALTVNRAFVEEVESRSRKQLNSNQAQD